LEAGGRLIYVGAGTAGRLAVLAVSYTHLDVYKRQVAGDLLPAWLVEDGFRIETH